jgi:hypothetical protein
LFITIPFRWGGALFVDAGKRADGLIAQRSKTRDGALRDCFLEHRSYDDAGGFSVLVDKCPKPKVQLVGYADYDRRLLVAHRVPLEMFNRDIETPRPNKPLDLNELHEHSLDGDPAKICRVAVQRKTLTKDVG